VPLKPFWAAHVWVQVVVADLPPLPDGLPAVKLKGINITAAIRVIEINFRFIVASLPFIHHLSNL